MNNPFSITFGQSSILAPAALLSQAPQRTLGTRPGMPLASQSVFVAGAIPKYLPESRGRLAPAVAVAGDSRQNLPFVDLRRTA
jgi:hypothetical protein